MKGEFIMKALKSVQISLIFVLLLGLLVAWTATVPQQISGDRLLGAAVGCACDDYSEANCGGSGCTSQYWKCNGSGDKKCREGGAPYNCSSDCNCTRHLNEYCA